MKRLGCARTSQQSRSRLLFEATVYYKTGKEKLVVPHPHERNLIFFLMWPAFVLEEEIEEIEEIEKGKGEIRVV